MHNGYITLVYYFNTTAIHHLLSCTKLLTTIDKSHSHASVLSRIAITQYTAVVQLAIVVRC